MNKNLSLAIEKAVEKINPKNTFPTELNKSDKKPDLFSLTSRTELFQNEKGITIKIDRSKDEKLTDFGKATLSDRYLGQNESYQDLFARVACTVGNPDFAVTVGSFREGVKGYSIVTCVG